MHGRLQTLAALSIVAAVCVYCVCLSVCHSVFCAKYNTTAYCAAGAETCWWVVCLTLWHPL